MTQQKRLKLDSKGIPIQAGVSIDDILNESITTAGWTAITIPANIYPKSMYITTRDQSNFLFSHLAAGTRYSTLPSGFGIDFAADAEETVFYIKGTSPTTIEIILLG